MSTRIWSTEGSGPDDHCGTSRRIYVFRPNRELNWFMNQLSSRLGRNICIIVLDGNEDIIYNNAIVTALYCNERNSNNIPISYINLYMISKYASAMPTKKSSASRAFQLSQNCIGLVEYLSTTLLFWGGA